MRPAALSKNIIFVNGTDAIGGVESGRTLTYHEGWRLYLAYVSREADGSATPFLISSADVKMSV